MSAIRLSGVTAGYGRVMAIRGVDVHVDPGEIVAVLGPNGAGKTTCLRTISGVLGVESGSVTVLGAPVAVGRAHDVARRGLAVVPQGRALAHRLTVADNLRIVRESRGLSALDDAFDLFPALAPLRDRRCGLLSGGEQQMLAVARALVRRPAAIVIDEMSHGLAPVVIKQLAPVIRRAASESQAAVLLVEQHTTLALELADRIYAMSRGRIVAEDSGSSLGHDSLVARYFGGEEPQVP